MKLPPNRPSRIFSVPRSLDDPVSKDIQEERSAREVRRAKIFEVSDEHVKKDHKKSDEAKLEEEKLVCGGF